jgi:hypothetical protein
VIGYVVQSVPSRRALRERLLEGLPPAVVIEDDGPPPGNPWRGYQLCLHRILEEGWEQAVIVQDDAIACENFQAVVERIATIFFASPVCLFYPGAKMKSWRYQREAKRQGSTFFPLNKQDFVPVVAVLWPREQVESLLSWADGRSIPGLRAPYRSDDAVIGSWMRHTKTTVYAAMPSLVQHPDDTDPVKDGPQKAGHGHNRSRVASSFVDGDPLAIEWASPNCGG